jgi:hypothetical protein
LARRTPPATYRPRPAPTPDGRGSSAPNAP